MVSFFGCKKAPENATTKVKPIREFAIISTNSSNPNDTIGHLHNYAMDYLGTRSWYPNSETQALLFSADSTFLRDSTGYSISLNSTSLGMYDTIFNFPTSFSQLLLPPDTMFNRYKRTYLTRYSQNNRDTVYINYLESQFENLYLGSVSVSSFVSNLESQETTISADVALNSDGKIALLSSYSVARNSMVYWNDALTNAANPWYGKFSQFSSNELPDGPIAGAVGDVIGALGGFGFARSAGKSNQTSSGYGLGLAIAYSAIGLFFPGAP